MADIISDYVCQTDDKARTLQRVADAIEGINDTRIQSNIAASTAVLAGLVLDKELIKKLLRSDAMRESVIYQDIQKEAREKERQEIAIKLINRGIEVEIIAETTGLPIEKIRALQTNRQNNATD
jgi:predicted transposase YdaD